MKIKRLQMGATCILLGIFLGDWDVWPYHARDAIGFTQVYISSYVKTNSNERCSPTTRTLFSSYTNTT